jgi:hypothetical protein
MSNILVLYQCHFKTCCYNVTLTSYQWLYQHWTLNILLRCCKSTRTKKGQVCDVVGYHEELWTPNIQLLLFTYMFGWFLFVVSYVCLIFTIQWSDIIELGWVIEQFLSYYGNCSWIWLMLITKLGDGWWDGWHGWHGWWRCLKIL